MIRNASQREILRIGRRFAPQFGRHRRPNGLLQAIKGTLQSGDIKTILILGASAKSSLTRLAVEAARSNPNLPTVTCAGLPVDTGFRQLSRRLESIPEFFFVDLRHVIDDFKKSDFRIDAVVIDQIDGRLALQLSQHGLNCDFIFVSVKPEMSEDASVLDWIDGRKYFTTREWPLETGSMLMMKRREPAVEQPVPCCFE